MASDVAVADAVLRLYTAAGRSIGERGVELQMFLEALSDVGDTELQAAVAVIVRREEWVHGAPSPGMVRSVVAAGRRRAELDVLALPPPRSDRTMALKHLTALRRIIGSPEPITEERT